MPELKNSYDRGIECEKHVESYFHKLGYTTLERRFKTPFSEIDLIMQNSIETLLIEVKSLGRPEWLDFRVNFKQRARLLRAFCYLQEKFSGTVRFHLTTVTKDGDIKVYEDFLS